MRPIRRTQSYQERKFETLYRELSGVSPGFPGKYANLVQMEEAVVEGLESARRALSGDVTGLTDIIDQQDILWSQLRDEFLYHTVMLAKLNFCADDNIRQQLMAYRRLSGQGISERWLVPYSGEA